MSYDHKHCSHFWFTLEVIPTQGVGASCVKATELMSSRTCYQTQTDCNASFLTINSKAVLITTESSSFMPGVWQALCTFLVMNDVIFIVKIDSEKGVVISP